MDRGNIRKVTTREERRTKYEEIDDVAKQIQEQEAESREAKTRRLRALRLGQQSMRVTSGE